MKKAEKTKKTSRKIRKASRGILWRVLLIIAAVMFAAVLELGKHTILGWILAAIVICGFIIIRIKILKGSPRAVRLLAWLGFLAAFACILWISWPPYRAVPAVEGKSAGTTDIVHVSQGDLTGVLTEDGKVEVYAGIPYAKPPVGDLRWREPEPADGWEGVMSADTFAPMSMQGRNLPIYESLAQIIGYHDYRWFRADDNYREPVSEDSLYLNIWKPAGDSEGLPVLVYVHGGSLQTGQPWYRDYSGEGLAREGVIVVNMGYRLGIFGFFADPGLAAESANGTTGNYGLLDQIMALRWVQDNIDAFGGDPGNVTLAGESAGSACVSALCTSPLAKGLFRRVCGESSTVTAPEPAHSFRFLDEAFEEGARTLKRWNVSSADELRGISAEKLASEMEYHHHITVDGYVLNETPYESYAKGIHNEEAQFQGYNREEGAPFILFSQANLKNYEQKVREAFARPGNDSIDGAGEVDGVNGVAGAEDADETFADRILALYPASDDAEARCSWADLNTIYLFTYGHYCWERQALANDIPVYVYHFTKDNGRLGPWHSGEEVYLYGNIPDDSPLYSDEDRELSRSMLLYYRNFIAYGDPNGDGLPEWPASNGDFMVQEFGDSIVYTPAPYGQAYEILDEMYGFGK